MSVPVRKTPASSAKPPVEVKGPPAKDSSNPPLLPEAYSFQPHWGPEMWGEDVFSTSRLWRSNKIIIPAASMGTVPLTGAPMIPVRPQVNLWDFIVQLTNEIHSLDLEFKNVPTNQGTGLCRFPEFTPRAERPQACTLKIYPNTKAHVYGEIRPVFGKNYSIINRWTVDYTPHLINLSSGVMPNLEIQGFAAVDTPKMTYDKTFKKRQSVLSMVPADFEYENPLETGGPLKTTFGERIAGPPSGRNDWMIRFSPLNDTVVSNLMEAGADSVFENEKGRGRLMLWPFLPTLGLYEEKPYRELGIGYNTFPRRLGDLISLFFYLRGDEGKRLRQSAPFINPNTEYIDRHGKRKTIPKDPRKVVALNKIRKKWKLPELGRNRGSIVDWYFRDLVNDPDRLLNLKSQDLPYGKIHLRLNPTELRTPLGTIEVKETTDIKAKYYAWRKRNKAGDKLLDRGLGLRLKAQPLDLGKIDLELKSFHLEAESLKADEASVKIPSLRSLGLDLLTGGPKGKIKPVKVVLKGVKAKDLVLHDSIRSFDIVLKDAELTEVSIVKHPDGIDLSINGIKAHGVNIDSPFGNLVVNTAILPFDKSKDNPQTLQIKIRLDDKGKPKFTEIKIPRIQSSGGFKLKERKGQAQGGNPLPFHTEGSSTIENFIFTNQVGPTHSNITTAFNFSGAIESARTQFEPLGGISFSTIEGQGDSKVKHSVSGSVEAKIFAPNDPDAAKLPPDYTLKMKLPYVGFITEGRFKVPKGGAALRNAEVTVKPGFIVAEGDLNMVDATLTGLGEKATRLGRLILPENSPILENLSLNGRAKFQLSEAGWSLSRAGDPNKPLNLGMSIKDSRIDYEHDYIQDWIGQLPSAKVIGSWAQIDKAKVEVEDFQFISWQRNPVNEKGEVTQFKTGPLTIHHVEGKGVLWAPLAIWGYVRGLFPSIGKVKAQGNLRRPSASPLMQHLSAEVQKKLGTGDFFRLGGVEYQKFSDGTWHGRLDDMLLNVHEEGGRWQYGMVRLPQIELKGDATNTTRKISGNFLASIYLNDPDRGGYFRIYRWPKKP